MSYTADPRILFAAERTLLAWQRSAIALMGFGFVVERFGLFLQTVAHQPESVAQRGFSLSVGVALLLLGAAAIPPGRKKSRSGRGAARILDSHRRGAQRGHRTDSCRFCATVFVALSIRG
jgi:uncharacterized membrane protein YidH (DUF202 family)